MSRIAAAVLLIVLIVLFRNCSVSELPAGRPALGFTAEDLSGNTISLSDYRGKVVLLDFWATWCGPCLSELPNVKRVYKKYRDEDFVVIGISLDSNREQFETFILKQGIEWPQIFDGKGWDNEVSQLYNIFSIPSTFLVDRDGIIRYTNLTGPNLERSVKALLRAPASENTAGQTGDDN